MKKALSHVFVAKYGLDEKLAQKLAQEFLSSEFTDVYEAATHLAATGEEIDLLAMSSL